MSILSERYSMCKFLQSTAILLVCLILSACSPSTMVEQTEEIPLLSESVSEMLPFDFLLPDGYTAQYKSDKEVSIILDNQIIGGIICTGLDPICITDVKSDEVDSFLKSIAAHPIFVQYLATAWDNKLYVSLSLENIETGERQEQSHCLFESGKECFDIWIDRALVDDENRDYLFETVAG